MTTTPQAPAPGGEASAEPSAAPDATTTTGPTPAEAAEEEEEARGESEDRPRPRLLLPFLPLPASMSNVTTEALASALASLVRHPLAALFVGVAIGARSASLLLESECGSILSSLRSECTSVLRRTQADASSCRARLWDDRSARDADVLSLELRRRRAERSSRSSRSEAEELRLEVERRTNETIAAYRLASAGLERAERVWEGKVRFASEEAETFALEASQSERRLSAMRHSAAEAERSAREAERVAEEEARACSARLAEAEDRVRSSEGDVDAISSELELRDEERIECDAHHRELMGCRASLLEGGDGGGGDAAAAQNAQREALVRELRSKARTIQELEGASADVAERNRELAGKVRDLSSQVRSLTDRGARGEVRLRATERDLGEATRTRDEWEAKARGMMEKVSHRSKMEVLERFGPGPHLVELSVRFPAPPAVESLMIELAPLDSMPHTVHTFLDLIHRKMYVDGTFVLVREHILVAGPVDAHNLANNQKLEDKMIHEGYFPHGALLFNEYRADYPHVPLSVGFNVNGGPVLYVNLMDNTQIHGPGDEKRDADPCFGKIVGGEDLIERITDLPRADDDSFEAPIYIVDTRVVNRTAKEDSGG